MDPTLTEQIVVPQVRLGGMPVEDGRILEERSPAVPTSRRGGRRRSLCADDANGDSPAGGLKMRRGVVHGAEGREETSGTDTRHREEAAELEASELTHLARQGPGGQTERPA